MKLIVFPIDRLAEVHKHQNVLKEMFGEDVRFLEANKIYVIELNEEKVEPVQLVPWDEWLGIILRKAPFWCSRIGNEVPQ